MASDWKLWSVYKHKHLVAQFLLAALFVGLAFRLLLFRSPGFNPDLEASAIVRSKASPERGSDSDSAAAPPVNVSGARDRVAQPPLSVDVPEAGDRIREPIAPLGGVENEDRVAKSPAGDWVAEPPVAGDGNQTSRGDSVTDKCDLFTGDWVPDPTGPLYTNETCHLIEGHQNCMRNGRPDTGYLYWRWSPRNCELPRFDPQRFLDLMRNKTWAFVGDSISRNHVQSLLCILSTVEQAIEIYHDEAYKSKSWSFPSHNLTVSVIWSPFLVQATIFEDDNGVSTSEVELHLDKLDKTWTDPYQTFDYTIISTGKWFLKNSIYHENNTILGCHNCNPTRNLTEVGYDRAYRKALTAALTFIATRKGHNGVVMFRTSTPDHFDGGEWHNGGECRGTEPVRDGEVLLKELDRYFRYVELEVVGEALDLAGENGVDLRLVDLTKLALLRPDGHPGPYRKFRPFNEGRDRTVQNDCLHWCLPGPIDAWNDVIMEMMLRG